MRKVVIVSRSQALFTLRSLGLKVIVNLGLSEIYSNMKQMYQANHVNNKISKKNSIVFSSHESCNFLRQCGKSIKPYTNKLIILVLERN